MSELKEKIQERRKKGELNKKLDKIIELLELIKDILQNQWKIQIAHSRRSDGYYRC